MQTSQSAQSPYDNAPKKVSLADGGSSVNALLLSVFLIKIQLFRSFLSFDIRFI